MKTQLRAAVRLLATSGNDRTLITKAIKDFIKVYKKEHNKTPYSINDGMCEDFAHDVQRQLANEGVELSDVEGDSFRKNDKWDVKLLKRHWPKVVPPKGLTWGQLDSLDVLHVWLTDGKLHYDAETPNGVENFFDLPIFKKAVKGLK